MLQSFQGFIEDYLVLKGYSVASRFSEAVGIDRSTLSKWRKGTAVPDSADIMEAIADAFQCSFEEVREAVKGHYKPMSDEVREAYKIAGTHTKEAILEALKLKFPNKEDRRKAIEKGLAG